MSRAKTFMNITYICGLGISILLFFDDPTKKLGYNC